MASSYDRCGAAHAGQEGRRDRAAGHGTRSHSTGSRRRTEQNGTLGRIQLGLALSAGKLTANAGRLLRVGGGASLPGIVARRIDPCVLRRTYLHGPVLPKNPWFTDHLIWQGLRRRRYGDVPPLAPLRDNAEERAHQAALRMALRSRGTMTALDATRW